jgi:hypothetical protein
MRRPDVQLLRRLYQDRERGDVDRRGDAQLQGSTGLKLTLFSLAVYTGLLGLLFLLAQDAATVLLEIVISDSVAFHQWGAALVMLASLAALLATDPLRYRRLLLVPLLGLPLDCLVLGYDLLRGASTLRQLGAALLINLVLFAMLAFFYPRKVSAGLDEGAL